MTSTPTSPSAELVDCDTDDHGCQGGLPDQAYKFIEFLGGLEEEKDYPYEARNDQCRLNRTDLKVGRTPTRYNSWLINSLFSRELMACELVLVNKLSARWCSNLLRSKSYKQALLFQLCHDYFDSAMNAFENRVNDNQTVRHL